jgi:hypothetical protein
MEGHLVMSAKERERLKIFARVKEGKLQQKEAGRAVPTGVSVSAAAVQTVLRAGRASRP